MSKYIVAVADTRITGMSFSPMYTKYQVIEAVSRVKAEETYNINNNCTDVKSTALAYIEDNGTLRWSHTVDGWVDFRSVKALVRLGGV